MQGIDGFLLVVLRDNEPLRLGKNNGYTRIEFRKTNKLSKKLSVSNKLNCIYI